ncbi:MAG: 4Fe-4S binding protein [Methanomassiliicoccales archaeon]
MSFDIQFGRGDEMVTLVTGTRSSRPRSATRERKRGEVNDRIAVFLCRCGGAIGNRIDLEMIRDELLRSEKNIDTYVLDFACTANGRTEIKRILQQIGSTRFVIAGCSPKTHELLFRELALEIGLNPFMFEMANIREQCAFVHDETDTMAKARALIRGAISKCRFLLPPPYDRVPITYKQVLVVGNGISALTAAESVAREGIKVTLLNPGEGFSSSELKLVSSSTSGEYTSNQLRKIEANPLVRILNNTKPVEYLGFAGNFRVLAMENDKTVEIECGAIIIAFDSIIGQESGESYHTLSIHPWHHMKEMASGKSSIPSRIVIILAPQRDTEQSCGLRDGEVLTHAINIKKLRSDAEITVIVRDVRTYGFDELTFRDAQEQGIRIIRTEKEPVIERSDSLAVIVDDIVLGAPLRIRADDVIVPPTAVPTGAEVIARAFRLPLTEKGFLKKTQVKLKPAASIRRGIFLCGTAVESGFAPEKFLDARVGASRAVALIRSGYVDIGGAIAEINPEKCSACLTCVRSCPYDAPFIGEVGKAEIETEKCMGCGICVGICPSKAIEMYCYSDAQLHAQVSSIMRG